MIAAELKTYTELYNGPSQENNLQDKVSLISREFLNC